MRPIVEHGRQRFRAYRQRRADDRAWSNVELPSPYAPPRSVTAIPAPDRRLRLNRRRRDPMSVEGRIVLGLVVLISAVVLVWGWRATRVDADLIGFEDGSALTPADTEGLEVEIEVSPSGRLDTAALTFDGRDIREEAIIEGDTIRWAPAELEEGEHTLSLTVARPILPDATMSWDFTIDGTPPRIAVPPYLPPHEMDEPVEIEGTVEGAEELRVDGEPYEVESDGSFALSYRRPPPGPIRLTAVDAAGNDRTVHVAVPAPYPAVRGVHVTAQAWKNDSLRQGILDLVDAGLVDTVELDIKDEGGIVGHTTGVSRAREAGAGQDLYDLRRQVDLLHEKGARVMGRVVAFRDPKLADWAWANGRRDMLIQNPEGGRFGAYDGGFTNFAHPDVQRYNLALAIEAAEAGVDDIMWDYVRRPEGDLETMVIPGLEGNPESAIVDFLSKGHERLRRRGVYQGAAVFGVAATRPEQSAQNILQMAYHTDYIAPMLYPSHWNAGEYGVDDPESQPYEIVKRSLDDFQRQVHRTGRPLVPWIQHFSLRVTYGASEIEAQVRAAREMGYESWMMWDPQVTYDADALRALG